VVIRNNVGRNRWALALTGLGSCLIIAAACAGGDTPPRDADLEERIRSFYDPDYPAGAAGSVNMAGGGGTGGSASGVGGSASGTGGSGSGTGGSASGGASGSGAAGSGSSGSGSSGSGSTGPVCDAPTQVFAQHCSFQPCHGDGSTNGSFADSEAAAKALLDKSTKNTQCGKYIDSGDPAQSALLLKLNDPPCGGSQMPLGADPLEQADIDCVESWLSQF
jgi:hypothetical protein